MKTRKKTKQNSIPIRLHDLPPELIYDILIKVPAHDLYNLCRHVCKLWYDIISNKKFITHHTLRHNKPNQLFISYPVPWEKYYRTKVVDINFNHKNTLELKLRNAAIRHMRPIRSSCDGLILIRDVDETGILHVMNLVTKWCITLPTCPSNCLHMYCSIGIVLDSSKNEYKIVHINRNEYYYEIFPLSSDNDSNNTWRIVPAPIFFIYDQSLNRSVYWKDPVLISGDHILHWNVHSSEFVISMDIIDESSRRTFLPKWGNTFIDVKKYEILDMGGYLSFVYKTSNTQIDIWMLEDFQEHRWIKKHSITKESTTYVSEYLKVSSYALPSFMNLFAVAALGDGDVIIFKHQNSRYVSRFLFLYEIKKRELRKLVVNIKSRIHFIPYRTSLLFPS